MKPSVWWQIGVPFLAFVVAGSVALAALLQVSYRRQSYRDFTALAAANAEFVRSVHLPADDRFANYLSQVLGVEVHFRRVPAADRRHQAVTVTVEPGFDLTLIRETPSLRALLLRPVSLLAFGAFWGFSLALAWVMARRFLATARLAVLGKMAASLAHEIHNPVAAIRLHAQLGEPAALPLIRAEADRIESLVNQWQFLAKPTPPATSPVDLHDVVATVATALAAQAEHARVTIATNVPVGSLVRADRRRLEQALRNIAWNAIQAMPGGGKLTFEYRDGRLGVLDTGRGFSPTALARGTELFFSEREGGMGIGLSVAHEIIRAHGGALTLENSPTGGASVWLKLPPAS